MRCPFCNAQETKVTDSRMMQDGHAVRRRRKCEACHKRFTTFEKIELTMPQVIKNDGRREAFQRNKILLGLQKACQKRPISVEQIDRIIENIEKKIIEKGESEISSNAIGQLIMSYLNNLDPVAYVRFASVYKTFQDIDEFLMDLKLDQNYKATQIKENESESKQ
jgi:transcriptional repressor NrdR